MSAQPEAALLIACARVPVDGPHVVRIRQLVRAGLDWTRVLDLAAAHGMRPLLYHHLNAACADGVPHDVILQLRAFAHMNAARNLVMARELLSLLSMLAAAGVQAVPYKGPVLAQAIYGNLGLREFTDLDILIRPADATRARALMLARGYRPQYALVNEHDAAFRRADCEYTFTHTEHGTTVEIQWALAPRFFSLTLDREGLERRLGSATLLGTPTLALSPEDLLFILCVHGCKHAWSQLEWICGVAETIRVTPGMDWPLVLSLADAAGARRMLLLGLAVARDRVDAALPVSVNRLVDRDAAVSRLAAEILGRRLDDNGSGTLRRALVHLQMRERWADRIRYCVRLPFTPTARDLALLSPAPGARYVAYPVRMARLALKYASNSLSSRH